MPRKRKNLNKEDICEDCCFSCKDGGLLVVCDSRNCLKAYHPACVGRDDLLIETGERWICNWHSCFSCQKKAKFQCFCCPQAVCGRCIVDVEFAYVRGNKGFCKNCLTLALLMDECKGVDSDGGRVDFNDRDTYEFFFKEYLERIKDKEGLTWEHIRCSANSMKDKNYSCEFGSNEISKMEEYIFESEEENDLDESDYDELEEPEEYKPHGKKNASKKKIGMMKEKGKNSKRAEFIGWGSKTLFEFLASIGQGTSKQLSQYDVTTIVTDYCIKNKLFHSEKKKKIICDARLQCLLGRKSLNKNSIYNLLTAHFAENFEQSEDDDFGSGSEHKDEGFLGACKSQRKLKKRREDQEIQETKELSKSCFASIIAENIKLVYLKRSLVEQLLKEPKTFDTKVVGSFVRVKSEPNDYLQSNSHQLLQVKGVNGLKNSEMNEEILLELSNSLKNVPICKLSDDNFCEEECKDLHQRMNAGLLKKPTVVELEEKARSLHEDITKHWIAREITLLQKQIERANEKGWRREIAEYIGRKLLLQSPSEQSRLLEKLPEVIADVLEIEPVFDNSFTNVKQGPNSFPESPVGQASQTPSTNLGSETNSSPNGRTDVAAIWAGVAPEMKHQCNVYAPKGVKNQSRSFSEVELPQESHISVEVELPQESHIGDYEVQSGLRRKRHHPVLEIRKSCSKSLFTEEVQGRRLSFASESQSSIIAEKRHRRGSDIGEWKNRPTGIQKEQVENKSSKSVELDELGDDDRDHEDGHENPAHAVWYYLGPHDEVMGPYSVSMLKQWCDTTSYEMKYKVWKAGQSQEEAIFLTDAIRQFGSDIGGKGRGQPNEIQMEDMENKSSKSVKLIELSDSDEDGDHEVAHESSTCAVWHYLGPHGQIMGPYSMEMLKRWRDSSSYEMKYKVWKKGQSQKDAIFLNDAIRRAFCNS